MAKATTKTKEDPKGDVAVATKTDAALLANAEAYASDAGSGFGDTNRDDYAIPFLRLLQSNSPQVDESDGAYVEGARPGMIFNTVSRRLYSGKDGLGFIPCARVHNFLEYVPRDAGGGFAGVHEVESDVVLAARAAAAGSRVGKLPHGDNELVETFSLYGIAVVSESDFEHAVVSFASTQIKKYRSLMTTARSQSLVINGKRISLPLFAHVYLLQSQPEENKKGKFNGWRIGFKGGSAEAARLAPDSELYQAAKAFSSMVNSGAAKADYSRDVAGAAAADAEDDTI